MTCAGVDNLLSSIGLGIVILLFLAGIAVFVWALGQFS